MARLLHYALAFAAAVTLNFALPRLMPGTPIAALAGADVISLTAAERDALVERAGLDRPLHVQYARYLGDLLRGDLGYSYQRNTPVAAILAERLPWTLLLLLVSQSLALAVGVALGAIAAWHRGRRADASLITTVIVCDAMPLFWVAMLFLALFAVQWPWFPLFGAVSPWAPAAGLARVADILHHMWLPAATLTIGGLAGTFLVARASLGAVLDQPYLVAARARGSGAVRLIGRHALPNALPPIVAAGAVGLGLSIGGSPLVETVFSYPGIGRLVYEAVLSRDYPVLQGAFLLITVVVIVVNAIADVAHGWLDPRLRMEARE